jgi:basic membrane protein A and related proteins
MASGMVTLSKFNPGLPPALAAEVTAKGEEIRAGKLHVFAGPLQDQAGAVRVRAGRTMGDTVNLPTLRPPR